jgi:predicted DNA-binding transcriptional regulator AlpA
VLSERAMTNPHATVTDTLANVQLMSPRQVEQAIGLKAVTLFEMATRDEFPRPIVVLRDKSGRPRKRVWRANEVREWIEAKANER